MSPVRKADLKASVIRGIKGLGPEVFEEFVQELRQTIEYGVPQPRG
jgi:hypothetical protein